MKNFLVVLTFFSIAICTAQSQEKPNILWITCEDISPYLGCYGFQQAQTPNLDKLASEGIRFTNAYANAPVCGVARTTLLTGMYAPTTGTHNFRTNTKLPESIPAYPKILREAGYYCTNNYKKDYNSSYETDKSLWDESSKKAHYNTRKPGQPFFAVFNIIQTHESQLAEDKIKEYVANGDLPKKPRINPSAIVLPPYHPDVPEIRVDWARFHDLITLMDRKVGELLQELKDKNLEENTIVFFYSDHGGMLSRSKRYLYNVGTQVPFIAYFPKKWRHLVSYQPGSTEDGFVSFVDFPKTLLSIANCPVPEKMQGKVFLGKDKEAKPNYVHFYRDRMSERYDFNRAVTDGEYYLIQNFVPHRPRGRSTRYGYTVQQNWRANEESFANGNSNAVQSQFYQPKETVELFNTKNDPWHIKSIAEENESVEKLAELSQELDRWMIEIRDIGCIPEPMFHDLVGEGKKYATIYEYAQSDAYEIEKILPIAKLAAQGSLENKNDFLAFIEDSNPIIRYWGAYGIFRIAQNDTTIQEKLIQSIEKEPIPVNRLIAAQALALSGAKEKAFEYLHKETKNARDGYVFLFGLNALQYSHTDEFLTKQDWIDFKAQTFETDAAIDKFGKEYSKRIMNDALALWPNRRVVD
ncbi:Arylsulfatase A [Lutibacter agarilyticus]|uniref:Arylsulfatase A n=1 Tax=Lutibacter agarilyticus TaxID=1109740 RepID=A0A238YKF3_9FLAO|nr:sulfatase [Lutibacter agarilyticus]SNR70899.1 Arylsulfatase A [Lutibacter agarilyticus]